MERINEYKEILRYRYSCLYGQKDCEMWVNRELRKITAILMIFLLIISVVIYNDISANRKTYSNVKVNENGEIVEVYRPAQGSGSYSFTTNVKVLTDSGVLEKEYYITIEPAGKQTEKDNSFTPETSERNSAEEELKKMISGINDNTESSKIVLPQSLENGDEIVWSKTENTDLVIYI